MAEQHRQNRIRVWDIWTRLFHWLFAAAIVFLLVSGQTGFQFFEWHRQAGEFVLLLLAFRLIWGIIGSGSARLLPMVKSPVSAVKHLIHLLQGKPEQTVGHNAAGGWAVLIMLALVSFQAISGILIADEDELIEGAFYGTLSADLSERLLHLHHLNAKFLMIIVGLHVFMILFYLLRAGQNLISPMISGRMHWSNQNTPPNMHWASAWIGLLVLLVVAGVISWLFGWFGL